MRREEKRERVETEIQLFASSSAFASLVLDELHHSFFLSLLRLTCTLVDVHQISILLPITGITLFLAPTHLKSVHNGERKRTSRQLLSHVD